MPGIQASGNHQQASADDTGPSETRNQADSDDENEETRDETRIRHNNATVGCAFQERKELYKFIQTRPVYWGF